MQFYIIVPFAKRQRKTIVDEEIKIRSKRLCLFLWQDRAKQSVYNVKGMWCYKCLLYEKKNCKKADSTLLSKIWMKWKWFFLSKIRKLNMIFTRSINGFINTFMFQSHNNTTEKFFCNNLLGAVIAKHNC